MQTNPVFVDVMVYDNEDNLIALRINAADPVPFEASGFKLAEGYEDAATRLAWAAKLRYSALVTGDPDEIVSHARNGERLYHGLAPDHLIPRAFRGWRNTEFETLLTNWSVSRA